MPKACTGFQWALAESARQKVLTVQAAMSIAFQRQCKPMGASGFVWLWCRVKAECDELFGRKLNLYDLRLPGLNGSAPLVAGGWLILRLPAVDAASAVGGGSVLHGVMAFPAVRRVPKIVGSPPARGNLAGIPSVHNLPPFANKVCANPLNFRTGRVVCRPSPNP